MSSRAKTSLCFGDATLSKLSATTLEDWSQYEDSPLSILAVFIAVVLSLLLSGNNVHHLD
jgi:hypothetical protein